MFQKLTRLLRKEQEAEPDFRITLRENGAYYGVDSVYNKTKHEAWSEKKISECGLSILNSSFDYLSDLIWKMLDLENIDEERLEKEIHSDGTIVVYLWYAA